MSHLDDCRSFLPEPIVYSIRAGREDLLEDPRWLLCSLRRLIRQISRANPFWGTPILQKVLALLGYTVSTATIWKYIDRSGKEC